MKFLDSRKRVEEFLFFISFNNYYTKIHREETKTHEGKKIEN